MKKRTLEPQKGVKLGLGLGLTSKKSKVIESKKPRMDLEEFNKVKNDPHENASVSESRLVNDDDPLEQFMAEINKQAKHDAENMGSNITTENKYEDEDADGFLEKYFHEIEKEPHEFKNFVSSTNLDSDEEVYEAAMKAELGFNRNFVPAEENQGADKKEIDPLPRIDHSNIKYQPIKKHFYSPHPDIEKIDDFTLKKLLDQYEIHISGGQRIKMCTSFAHFGFPEKLLDSIARQMYSEPTPIQKQGVPVALSGLDIIGIAQTGSGKTGSFVWPMIVHILGQTSKSYFNGPKGLILAPTRELVIQIFNEARKYAKPAGLVCSLTFLTILSVTAIYGGVSKHEQIQEIMKQNPDIVISTPGRLIDIVKDGGLDLKSITFFVLDETDQMLNLGFERQVKSISDNIRPDRQTLLYSATFPRKIENLARKTTSNPVKITVGPRGQINEDILQEFYSFNSEDEKWEWLVNHIVEFTMGGNVLIFVLHKSSSIELSELLLKTGSKCAFLHGDMLQNERDSVLFKFKNDKIKVLIATDNVRTVINYETTRDFDSYIHRIGRTGRAGIKGKAVTLLLDSDPGDISFVKKQMKFLQNKTNEKDIPRQLLDYAQRNNIILDFRNRKSILNNPLSNPGLSNLVRGSRLPGDRSGLG
ncbi:hypothetical protein BB560_004449 [Smittium megazygosporum]|uniref:RNA helicase n=1 Tax=Smittium megazygosporum TaxID=133381 RepID=A0A2T9Z967_9FUNG|nr:hypothetical protein BB560_004449 [Smittium megazygosporum]